MRPILITDKTSRTTLKMKNSARTEDIKIEVTRTGGGDTIIYPALDSTDQEVTFMWDDALYNQKSGRFQGLIKIKWDEILCIPIQLECGHTRKVTLIGNKESSNCKGC